MFDTVEARTGLHQESDSGACSDGLTLAPASKAAAAAVGGSFCGCVHCPYYTWWVGVSVGPYYTWWVGLRAAAAADTFEGGSLPQAPAPVSCHWGREVAVASQWLHRGLEVAFQCLGSVLAVSCKCLGGVLAVSSQCLESVLEVS